MVDVPAHPLRTAPALHHLGPWTFEDLALLPDDGNSYEIDGGSLVVSPPPDLLHGDTGADLLTQLRTQAPADLAVIEGAGVRGDNGYRIPDLAVVSRALVRREARYAEPGDVRLVVEVVSPGSALADRVTKRALYAEWGIPLYWIVAIRPGLLLTVLELRDAAYEVTGEHRSGRLSLAPPSAPYPLGLDLDRLRGGG